MNETSTEFREIERQLEERELRWACVLWGIAGFIVTRVLLFVAGVG